MGTITIKQYFAEKPEQVFAVLSKHSTYNRAFWPIQVERIKDSADPKHPDGLGSIRQMGFGPFKPIHEQIIRVDPNRLIEYELIDNPLIKHHLGRLVFTPQDQGTLLTYTIELIGKVPFSELIILANLKVAITLGMAKLAHRLS